MESCAGGNGFGLWGAGWGNELGRLDCAGLPVLDISAGLLLDGWEALVSFVCEAVLLVRVAVRGKEGFK